MCECFLGIMTIALLVLLLVPISVLLLNVVVGIDLVTSVLKMTLQRRRNDCMTVVEPRGTTS